MDNTEPVRQSIVEILVNDQTDNLYRTYIFWWQ